MTIRIEVTGESLPEVADKLLAIGQRLRANDLQAANLSQAEVQDWTPAVEKAKPSRKAKVAEKPVAEPEQEDAGKAQTGEAQSPAEPAPEPEVTAQSAEASASEALDFDKDVAPVVIEAVQRTSREVVSETLSEFGAARASEVDEKLWPEMLERLKVL
jgi:hypothetical protein